MARYFPKNEESSGKSLIELLKERRSIRAFRNDPVSQEQINMILAAGNHSPSGGNRHPWRFEVICDDQLKKRIRTRSEAGDRKWHEEADPNLKKWLAAKHITTEKKFLTEAPVLIAVFGDSSDPYWLESVWISIGYMMLACVDQGLGTVIYTPGDPAYLNEVLDIPGRFVPQVILPVGYPLVKPQRNPTKQTEMEYTARTERAVREPRKKKPVTAVNNGNELSDLFAAKEDKPESGGQRKCGCGCGRPIVGLNSKRKYIHGHAKFGPNGLFDVLKNPPLCKCGCGEPTEWDWEKMTWKKYIDKHIGIQKQAERKPSFMKEQIDLFK